MKSAEYLDSVALWRECCHPATNQHLALQFERAIFRFLLLNVYADFPLELITAPSSQGGGAANSLVVQNKGLTVII